MAQQQRQVEVFNRLLKTIVAVLALLFSLTACQAATRVVDRDARLLHYENTPPNVRGDFSYSFQTSNAIIEKRAGNANGFSGVVQYVSLEGLPITFTYVADANGYHPDGEYIPKTPPHVLKSLEYIRTHAAVDENKSRSL